MVVSRGCCLPELIYKARYFLSLPSLQLFLLLISNTSSLSHRNTMALNPPSCRSQCRSRFTECFQQSDLDMSSTRKSQNTDEMYNLPSPTNSSSTSGSESSVTINWQNRCTSSPSEPSHPKSFKDLLCFAKRKFTPTK